MSLSSSGARFKYRALRKSNAWQAASCEGPCMAGWCNGLGDIASAAAFLNLSSKIEGTKRV